MPEPSGNGNGQRPDNYQQFRPASERGPEVEVAAERAILCALLLDPASLLLVRDHLQLSDFRQAKHGTIYSAIMVLAERGVWPDLVTLNDELEQRGALKSCGGAPYLADLTSVVPSSANIEYYVGLVIEAAKRRGVLQLASSLLEDAKNPATDPEAVIARAEIELGKIRQSGTARGFKPVSFQARQSADMRPRIWRAEGMFCPGFNMVTATKGKGKSFLVFQAGDAIAEGKPFLGRRTTKGKVLFVAFELDELDTSERFKGMGQLSENAFVVHSWPTEEKALDLAEQVIREYDFKVIVFDTFLPLLPPPRAFDINGYGDSLFFLKWRLLGKRTGTTIIATWHEGKSPRDDYMLSAIGSTGMVGQADSVVSIDRKRGDSVGKLLIGGNHAPESVIPFIFENGLFTLAEGQAAIDRLTPTEEKALTILKNHPDGCKTSAVAVALGRTDSAARSVLNRLEARGKASSVSRGIWSAATLL